MATPRFYWEQRVYQRIERVSKEKFRSIDPSSYLRQKTGNAGVQPAWANPRRKVML
jgi:hypothetical protein